MRSRDFSACSALLLRNQRTGEVAGLHIYIGGIGDRQVADMQALGETGDRFVALLLTGRVPEHVIPLKTQGITWAKDLVRKYLPGTPCKRIDVPSDFWDLAVDVQGPHTRVLVEDAAQGPFSGEGRSVLDYGDAFAVRQRFLG